MKKLFIFVSLCLIFIPNIYVNATITDDLSDSEVISNKKPLTPKISIIGNGNSLILGWDGQTSDTSYDVYRSTSKTKGYKKIATVNINAYTNKGLTYGKTYYYKIIAKNSNGKSSYSNIVSKKVVPNKVNNLKIEDVSGTSLKLTYSVNGAKGYEIYRSTNKTSGFKKIATTTKTSYIDKKLKTGTIYYYKVRAYALNKKKKIYGSYSDIYEFEVKLVKPTITTYNNSRSSLQFSISSSDKCSYEISRLDSGNVVETKAGTKITFNNLKYGSTYKFKAIAYKIVNGKRITSDEVYFEEMVRPSEPEFTARNQDFYNQQTLDVTVNGLQPDDNIEFHIYKKNNSGNYVEIHSDYEVNNSDYVMYDDDNQEIYGPFERAIYGVIIDNLTFNENCDYKLVLKINGVEAKTKYLNKISQVTPQFSVGTYDIDRMLFATHMGSSDVNEVLYYELSRSTSSNGKYSVIYDGAIYGEDIINNYLVMNTINAPFNKTYYYKIRFYKIIDGKKYYSNYSKVLSHKNIVKYLGNYPISMTINNSNSSVHGTISLKSLNFTLKKRNSDYSTYTMKFNFKQTKANKKNNANFIIRFYDMNDKEISAVSVDIIIPKGTKKNWSVTTNSFNIPNNASYYLFD